MRKLLFGSLLAICVLACGSSKSTTKSQTTEGTSPATQPASGPCGMKEMAGATATATDTSDGVAVEIKTNGDVAALRAHVHQMADMHNGMGSGEMHHDMGNMQMGSGEMHHDMGNMQMGSGEMHHGMGSGEMHEMHMVPSRATVEDITGGARITLVPTDASQLAALRSQVREHAAMMNKGECPK